MMAGLIKHRYVCDMLSNITLKRHLNVSLISPCLSRQRMAVLADKHGVRSYTTALDTHEPEYIQPSTNTLFLSKVSYHINERHLAKIFPDAIDIRLPRNRDKTKGIAYLDFRTAEEVDELVNSKERFVLDHKILGLHHYKPKEQTKTLLKAKLLYVTDLPLQTKAQDLKDLFSKSVKVRLGSTLNNEARYALVEFDNVTVAQEVLKGAQDKKKKLFGQPLTVLPYGTHFSKKFVDERNPSAAAPQAPPPDAYQLFVREDVQELLTNITGFDIKKIFKFQTTKNLRHPDYQLLTEQQLKEQELRTIEEGKQRLQMPPYLEETPDEPLVLDKTPEMEGFTENKYMFVDISKKKDDLDTLVVVRETDGTLRMSTREEKRRMSQIFFPREGRFMNTPRVFRKRFFEGLLDQKDYINLMDRACVQYEPESSEFIQICHRIYEHVHASREFDILRSTRFFGPMVYHLTLNKQVEPIMIDMLSRKLLDDAAQVVRLYHILHTDSSASASGGESDMTSEQAIQKFADQDANNSYVDELNTALKESLKVDESSDTDTAAVTP